MSIDPPDPQEEDAPLMRGTPKGHAPPEVTQPCPPDNTRGWVMAQVGAWRAREANSPRRHPTPYDGLPIHPESAMEIAAWWQAPGNAFTPFASTGTITGDLLAEIADEIDAHEHDPDRSVFVGPGEPSRESYISALRALQAYVRACTEGQETHR